MGLAVTAAMILRPRFAGSRIVTFIFQLPLPVPHLVAAAGMVLLLTQSGLFARLFYYAGVLERPNQFPVLVFDRWQLATILVYLWKEIPFMGLVVLAVLKGIGQEYEEIAQTLGANRWQRFRYVLLPLLMPGLATTGIIVFAFVFGSFEIPLLLGQRYPNVLPVTVYRTYIDPDLNQRPEAMAIGMIITAIVILLLNLAQRLSQRLRTGACEAGAHEQGPDQAGTLREGHHIYCLLRDARLSQCFIHDRYDVFLMRAAGKFRYYATPGPVYFLPGDHVRAHDPANEHGGGRFIA